MKKHLIILLILCNINIYAQNDLQGKTSIQLDIAPLIVPPYRVSIGVSHQLTPHFFVGAELGKSFSETWGRANDKSESYKLFQYRLEGGYIFNPEKKYVFHYLSVDFLSIKHTETLFDGSYYVNKNEIDEQHYSYDRIDYKRKKYAFNVNYGMKIFFSKSKKVGVDPKIGLGINNVDVDFSNAENLNKAEKSRDIFDFPNRYTRFGKETTLNINFQIRFFYVF